MSSVIGWDIGGAHVKAARAEGGRIVAVALIPCAPHDGLADLERALRDAAKIVGEAERHGVAMTAELSDAFENRETGVVSVAAIFARETGVADALFYAGAKGFVGREEARALAPRIASANWRASAELVARHVANALFIDMGSTTTDIIPIRDGAIAACGASDAERLREGELVYAGFSRGNPLDGVTLAPIAGRWAALTHENFATLADVRRLLGEMEAAADLSPTADGRGKSVDASHARLARLAGCDAADMNLESARAFAAFLARAQLRRIEDAVALLESRGAIAPAAPIVGAGAGRGVARRLAHASARKFIDVAEFIPATEETRALASTCAPAAAVALLLA
jgi:(4-(4-[2-(gamma-L-glutamylamino)ethyl]phenoxymethyl)furan-2-yl)methanamine synthase